MSIRKVYSVLIVSAAVAPLVACSNEPARAVAGPSSPTASPPVVHDRGFIWFWPAEAASDLIPMPSYAESMHPTAINNVGQVVGYVTLHYGQGDDRGFIWSGRDGLQLLGSLIGADGISRPLTIDDNGEVRGLSDGPLTRQSGVGADIRDPFVWTASTGMKPATDPISDGRKLFLPPGADCMVLVRTKTAGFAIGYAGSTESSGCKPTNAVMWKVDGTPVVIGQRCGARSCGTTLNDINNRGEVIGSDASAGVFRWTQAGGFVRIPVDGAYVNVINDNGDAAGSMDTDTGKEPLVWTASGAIVTMAVTPGVTFEATGINNSQVVVGVYR